jgi:hypothetical protein
MRGILYTVMGRNTVRFPWLTGLSVCSAYALCLSLALLAGCGDACLYCGGSSGGNGGGGQERTAEAGDVILADQFSNDISIYEYESEIQRSLLSGFDDVSGVALYSGSAEETCDNPFAGLDAYRNGGDNLGSIDQISQEAGEPNRLSLAVIPKGMTFPYGTDPTGNGQTAIELLFFTVNTEDTLYVYDLTGNSTPPGFDNPFPITNQNLKLLFGSDFLLSPTALVVNTDGNTATLFVVNDNGAESSVTRLSVSLTSWIPSAPQTIAAMEEVGWRLIDIAYHDGNEADELFVSMKTEGQVGAAGRIYVISNAASRTTPVTLDPDSTTAFVAQPYEITGITVAPTDDQQTQADLLSLRANELGQVEQFDIDQGGNPETVFGFSFFFNFPEALAYDCTNERLLMTDIPLNSDFARTFFQAVPSQ